MQAPLRVCVANMAQIITLNEKIPVGKVTNIRPSFEGGLGFIGDFLVDTFWFTNFNYTVIEATSFGIGGCQTLIVRNESDMAVALVEVPVNEDYDKVHPMFGIFHEPLIILQGYNLTSRNHNFADILHQSMMAFTLSLWIALAVILFLIGLMFKVRQFTHNWQHSTYFINGRFLPWKSKPTTRKNQNTSDPFFQVMSLFMHSEATDYSDAYRRVLSLVVTITSFVVITGYFCNLMSTDMVIVEKPKVLNSYQDIIDKESIIVLFAKTLTDYEYFRDAREGSIEKRMWDIMTKERSTEDVILFDPQGVDSLIPVLLQGGKGDLVMIISRLFEGPIRSTVCSLRQSFQLMKNIMTYAPKDPWSPVYEKSIIVRQTDIPILKRGIDRAWHVFEGGLVGYQTRLTKNSVLLPISMTETKDYDDLRNCISPELLVDKPGYQAATLNNFHALAKLYLYALLLSLVVLLMELVVKKTKTSFIPQVLRRTFRILSQQTHYH